MIIRDLPTYKNDDHTSRKLTTRILAFTRKIVLRQCMYSARLIIAIVHLYSLDAYNRPYEWKVKRSRRFFPVFFLFHFFLFFFSFSCSRRKTRLATFRGNKMASATRRGAWNQAETWPSISYVDRWRECSVKFNPPLCTRTFFVFACNTYVSFLLFLSLQKISQACISWAFLLPDLEGASNRCKYKLLMKGLSSRKKLRRNCENLTVNWIWEF